MNATRKEIQQDLTKLADKWRHRGMPGLAAIMVLIAEFYQRELEGYLLSMMASLHRLMSRIQGGKHFVETNTETGIERSSRESATDRRHSRKHVVLGNAKKGGRGSKTVRVERRG